MHQARRLHCEACAPCSNTSETAWVVLENSHFPKRVRCRSAASSQSRSSCAADAPSHCSFEKSGEILMSNSGIGRGSRKAVQSVPPGPPGLENPTLERHTAVWRHRKIGSRNTHVIMDLPETTDSLNWRCAARNRSRIFSSVFFVAMLESARY